MVWFHSVPAYGGSVLSDSMLLAQNDFEKEFTDWLSAGVISSVGWVVVVLLVVAVVMMASRRSSG